MPAPVSLVLLGHGGNYVDVVDLIEDVNDAAGRHDPQYRLLGYLDDRDALQGQRVNGYPVLGRYADAGRFGEALFSTWIGGVDSYLRRPDVLGALGLPAERFATLIHPTAYVSRRARLGRGVLLMANCTVTANVAVGDHVVVLPNSVLSHDDVVGDYTAITGGVMLAGKVTIGRSCYLGTNCSIHPMVTVGEGSLVGMGAVVRHDVAPYQVVAGNPARVLREVRRAPASGAGGVDRAGRPASGVGDGAVPPA